MARHAVLCQLQRLAKSVISLLKSQNITFGGEGGFTMDTKLQSDAGKDVVTLDVVGREGQAPESWLFVNGIAGEVHWQTLALKKLGDYFFNGLAKDKSDNVDEPPTMIKGIFNRSDGILWDLLECAGERRPDKKAEGINQRTQSSLTAQKVLTKELQVALGKGEEEIFMIAHSQGCLLLRLALEDLYDKDSEGGPIRKAMKDRLLVFTFGNPSYDWDVHRYTKRTEHFANAGDFVARLGVLRYRESRQRAPETSQNPYHCDDCAANKPDHQQQLIFINEGPKGKGHLFGAQYSFDKDDYEAGEDSLLLRRAKWSRDPAQRKTSSGSSSKPKDTLSEASEGVRAESEQLKEPEGAVEAPVSSAAPVAPPEGHSA